MDFISFFWYLLSFILQSVRGFFKWIINEVISFFWYLLSFIPQPVRGFFKWIINGVNRILWNLCRSTSTAAAEAFPERGQGVAVSLLDRVGASKAFRFHIMDLGHDFPNFHRDILKSLDIRPRDQVLSVDQSDVIMAFVPIVSRAGTDIQSALQKIPENRPVVLVVLYHTFNKDYVVPERRHTVARDDLMTVEFLFHEDQGILHCAQNTKALEATQRFLHELKCKQNRFQWF